MPKARVRELAREFGLMNAEKADSQDICFVPSGHYTEMIERLIPGASVPGEIVHADGRVLGRHGGVVHFTIGQRRGIGVAATEPLYVVGLDAANARVIGRSARLSCGGAASVARCQLDRSGRNQRLAVARIVDCRRGSLDASAGSALLMPTGEIEFVEPESGVSPVKPALHDSADPGARVLGGGFIVAA